MSRHLLRPALVRLLAPALALCIALLDSGSRAARPNLLLVVADDLGWNDVGYHNPEMRTPNLDALARTGVELDCHYVQPQCTPTRVALMTGRYPSRFGLECCQASNLRAFPLGTPTLASLLKGAGYRTGMSGKWHLGSNPEWGPNHYGFDYSHGSLTGAVGMYDHRYQLQSPFVNTWHRNHDPLEEEGHVTDLTAREAVRWIVANAETKEPWFFYVPFHAPHTPLVEREEKWTAMNAHMRHDDRRLFAAAVSHLDGAIGRIVDALDRTGQRERTLIVFTSDNGAEVNHPGDRYPPPDPKLVAFSSNKPLRGRKTEVYEGGYRVPAFVNWPGVLAPRKVSTPMHVVDWAPTLTTLLEIPTEGVEGWDGQDVWPTISTGDAQQELRTIYTVWGRKRNREALRHGDWKIARNRGEDWELFHLGEDPYETTDLRREEPDRYASLMGLYESERAKDAE